MQSTVNLNLRVCVCVCAVLFYKYDICDRVVLPG